MVGQLLREAEDGSRRLITSTVTIVEVAFAADSKGDALDPGTLKAIDNLWADGKPVGLADASTKIMYEARRLARIARSQGWKLTPRDAIHLATAVSLHASTLFTYEKKSRERWASVAGLSVEEPEVEQPPLI